VTTEIEPRQVRQRAAAAAVAVLAVAWVVGVGVLLWLLFEVAIWKWAASYDEDLTREQQLDRQGAYRSLWLAAVLFGGPLLIALGSVSKSVACR
jgi:hypothetical protein